MAHRVVQAEASPPPPPPAAPPCARHPGLAADGGACWVSGWSSVRPLTAAGGWAPSWAASLGLATSRYCPGGLRWARQLHDLGGQDV